MNSSWQSEILAVFRKEWLIESRTKTGFYTSSVFSVVAVVAIAFATFGLKNLEGSLAAGLLWVTLLFSAVVALPRSFVTEEEQSTADLLRLWARPHSVFWGKALFNLVQTLITSMVLSVLFLGLTNVAIKMPLLYLVGLIGGSAALSGAVTLCAALVAQAANRSALAGAISIPLLLPLVAIGVSATRVALGEGAYQGGLSSTVGLWLFATVVFTAGPMVFAAVWKA